MTERSLNRSEGPGLRFTPVVVSVRCSTMFVALILTVFVTSIGGIYFIVFGIVPPIFCYPLALKAALTLLSPNLLANVSYRSFAAISTLMFNKLLPRQPLPATARPSLAH